MFQFGEQNHIARLEILRAPSRGDQINSFRRAARKNNFVGRLRIDEFRRTRARGFKGIRRAVAQFMDTAMNIGVVKFVIMHERINDAAGLLRRGGVVEINQRLAVDLLMQNREVSAQFGPINHEILQKSELQLRRFGHHTLIPRRIPDEFDVRFVNRFEGNEFVLHVLREHGTHAATGRGQRHLHIRLIIIRTDEREVTIVNQTEVHDVDGDVLIAPDRLAEVAIDELEALLRSPDGDRLDLPEVRDRPLEL